MRIESLVIAGLPSSGKTTFLAALWDLVTSEERTTSLSLGKLLEGDTAHLNVIAKQWRNARIQERTPSNRRVRMNLLDSTGQPLQVNFPDVSGEAFMRMWEERDCDPELVDILKSRGVALFIHSDTIVAPRWIVDDIKLAEELGLPPPPIPTQAVEWQPRSSPTQVQLVDILQLLQTSPLGVGPRRIAVILSAWDKVEAEQLQPAQFLAARLPLLRQYLEANSSIWETKVYGISAQGGDYDPSNVKDTKRLPEAERLRSLDRASDRIRVVHGSVPTHDLTEPLAWLMS